MAPSSPYLIARLSAAFALLAIFAIAPAAVGAEEKPAEEAAPEKEAPPKPVAIPLEAIPERAEATTAALSSLLPVSVSDAALQGISEEFKQISTQIKAEVATATAVLAASPTVRRLNDLEQQLVALRGEVSDPDKLLDKELTSLSKALTGLDEREETWKLTHEAAVSAQASPATLRRIAATRKSIGENRQKLVAQRNEILNLRDKMIDPKASLDSTIGQIRASKSAHVAGIFSLDEPPLFSQTTLDSLRAELEAGWTDPHVERSQALGTYAQKHLGLLGIQGAVFLMLVWGLRVVGVRARQRADEDYDLREPGRAFEHPISMALVISIGMSPILHPLAPDLFRQILLAVVVVPAVLIVRHLAPPSMIPVLMGLPVIFLIDRARQLLERVPTLERFILVAELAGALVFFMWLMRPSRLAKVPADMLRDRFFRTVGAAMRIAVVLYAVAILAHVVGLASLGNLVGNGVLRAGYMALFVFTIMRVLQSVVAYALVLKPLNLLHMVSNHRWLIRRRISSVLRFGALVFGIFVVLRAFGLNVVAGEALTNLLGATLTVGAISISVGDVLVFGITVWVTFSLARFINFALQEDVFSRVQLARGVPYAMTSLIRYSMIVLGFIFALAAAGIEFSKLSIIAGGLGVGIGFGMQNVVNNFVSGLILLFERPLQIGDAVQIPTQNLWGEIKRIGIRASIIRTWDGAEVIVPNGQLVSDAVTNWTLSDRHRRVELNVGVEYGTDAQVVIDLLLEVARSHAFVLDDPPPRAFFVNFGDSALEFLLRVWIRHFDEGFSNRSELAVAIQAALREADIGVPFPQRDLHLRSVSPEARDQLGAAATGGRERAGTSDREV